MSANAFNLARRLSARNENDLLRKSPPPDVLSSRPSKGRVFVFCEAKQ